MTMDLITILRIGTMLIFITVFAGIALWLLTPAGRRSARDQGRMILDDEAPARPGEAP
ncbi:MAG: hypothetical protein JWO26_3259 [Rhodospirillales bacterium]|jgi:cbb3-type cytochrome oxidase subunit 3|nr:hypothetical protein [Rhodospirillales bacterium]MDB5383627.1 hypothetical protein [Rhodospirillales bacterium]